MGEKKLMDIVKERLNSQLFLLSELVLFVLLSVIFSYSIDLIYLLLIISIPIILLTLIYIYLPRKFKALLWKEWRELEWAWVIAIAGLIVSIPIPPLTVLLAFIYSWYIGARAFAGEREKGTYDYLITRPIHPRRILLLKYFVGIIQILTLLIIGFIIFFFPEFHIKYNKNPFSDIQFWEISIPFSLIFLMCIGSYSFCFLSSILVGDIVRSFLIGFPSVILIGFGGYQFIVQYDVKVLTNTVLWLLKLGFDLISLEFLVVGIIGVLFYSLYRRRLVWKTGFLLFIPLSLWLFSYTPILFYGDMKPVGETQDVKFLGTQYPWGWGELVYWDNKVFGFERLPKTGINQLVVVDVSHPEKPVSKTLIRLSRKAWTLQFDLPEKRFYVIDNAWTGFNEIRHYDKSGSITTTYQEMNSPKNSQLVVYDLSNLNKPQIIDRISFLTETAKYPYPQNMPDISIESTLILLTYEIQTGKSPYNWSHGIPPNLITTEKDVDKIPLGILRGIVEQPLWKWHQIAIDKKTLKIVKESDINPPEPDFYKPDSQNYGFDVYSNGFVIRDKENQKHFVPSMSILPWDWVDYFDNKFHDTPYYAGSISIQKNRAIVFYPRGFIIYDISDTLHPRKIGKMTSEKIQSWTMGNDYIYVYGPIHGFSIYKIPAVKS